MNRTRLNPRKAARAIAVGALLLALPAAAQDPCECSPSICSAQGFNITLRDFDITIDGRSVYTYSVCNGVDEAGQPTTCAAPRDLSHIDIPLPDTDCIAAATEISVRQIGCVSCDPTLSCGVETKDPSCDLCKAGTGVPGIPCQPPDDPSVNVLKCNVIGDLEGKCVTIEVSIAGEMLPGKGAVDVITKAANDCQSDSICGPSCPCQEELTDSCLTRTAGFWGTHPEITDDFLPVTICSGTKALSLDNTAAGSCTSATEAMCVSPGLEGNKKMDRKPAREQLARQLTAAALNLRATAANGGSCTNSMAAVGLDLAACNDLCGRTEKVIKESGCLQALDAFNNSVDTMSPAPSPFNAPGAANPGPCQTANGNGIIVMSCP